VGDLSLVTAAWLRLDNKQTGLNTVSANARFQLTDQKSSGHGTLTIFDASGVPHTVVIGAVTWITANQDCDAAFVLCAVISFEATIDGRPAQGTADAFGCELRVDEGGNQFYYCPIED
jgi:hypothetical protein